MVMSKIHWQCRRGLLELDLILSAFLEQIYPELSALEQDKFAELIAHDDQTLYNWLVRAEPVSDKTLQAIIAKIRAHYDSPSG